MRNIVEAAVEEEGHDVVLQDVVQRGGIRVVAGGLVLIVAALADRPAVGAVEGLFPPAVENAAIGQAVEAGLLAAGAAGLVGTNGGIEPDVTAAHQVPGHIDVVVFEEDNTPLELRLARELVDLADEVLAGLVVGMRLAGKNDLHRTLWVAQQPHQPLTVAKEQGRALVRGEAAREAQRERIGVQHLLGVGDGWRTLADAVAVAR